MILEGLLNLIFGLLKIVFGWISLPAFPSELASGIETFLNLIFDNITLLGFFIRPATITIVVPILIILVARLRTIYSDQIDNFYISSGISDFKYNYNIKIKEGSSFWFGFIHNSELINKKGSLQNDKTEFNFTVEFNPNKLEIKGILLYIIRMCYAHNCNVKSVDIAMDIPYNILDIRWL